MTLSRSANDVGGSSRRPLTDAERIRHLESAQNRVIDLQILVGDQTQDVLTGVATLQGTKRALATAIKDLEVLAATYRDDHDDGHRDDDDVDFTAAVAETFGPEVAAVVREQQREARP